MLEQSQVEALGEHRYLVRAQQGEDVVEILMHATPAVISRLTPNEADEIRIIQATAAYLLARQRADDLPPQLDLDDVVAAYEDFEDDLRRYLDNTNHDGPT